MPGGSCARCSRRTFSPARPFDAPPASTVDSRRTTSRPSTSASRRSCSRRLSSSSARRAPSRPARSCSPARSRLTAESAIRRSSADCASSRASTTARGVSPTAPATFGLRSSRHHGTDGDADRQSDERDPDLVHEVPSGSRGDVTTVREASDMPDREPLRGTPDVDGQTSRAFDDAGDVAGDRTMPRPFHQLRRPRRRDRSTVMQRAPNQSPGSVSSTGSDFTGQPASTSLLWSASTSSTVSPI